MTQANVLAQLGAQSGPTFRNRIINGAMVIDQRNAGASVTITTNPQYTLDRWFITDTVASKLSVQQNAGSVTPPTGFINYLGATSLSAYTVGATELFLVRQSIEGLNIADLAWGTANAKTVTLSAWVYSSLTGTFGGALRNSAGNRFYPFSYTISSANTWTQISITIIGDTTGTWLTTNGVGIDVMFSVGTGSTYQGSAGSWGSTAYYGVTGQQNVVSTNGATFYITGVQLEVGSSATGFEYRQYGTELTLCQRYYTIINDAFIRAYATSGVYQTITLPAKMRATPTLTRVGTWVVLNCPQPSVGVPGTNGTQSFYLGINATVIGDCYSYTQDGTTYITASAEL